MIDAKAIVPQCAAENAISPNNNSSITRIECKDKSILSENMKNTINKTIYVTNVIVDDENDDKKRVVGVDGGDINEVDEKTRDTLRKTSLGHGTTDQSNNIIYTTDKMCTDYRINGDNGSCNNVNAERKRSTTCTSSKGSRHGSFHLSPTASSLSPILLSPCRSFDSSCSDEEVDEIGRFFEAKSDAIQKWLKHRAPADVLSKIHAITEDPRSCRSPKRPSVTSELFQQWLVSSPVKVILLAIGNI